MQRVQVSVTCHPVHGCKKQCLQPPKLPYIYIYTAYTCAKFMPISSHMMPCREAMPVSSLRKISRQEPFHKVLQSCMQATMCFKKIRIQCAAVGGAFQIFDYFDRPRGFQLRPRRSKNWSLKTACRPRRRPQLRPSPAKNCSLKTAGLPRRRPQLDPVGPKTAPLKIFLAGRAGGPS